jgi:hypothetical protein
MPSKQGIELAKAVQTLRESVGETELLVADLTDALANALVERDGYYAALQSAEVRERALKKRLDAVSAYANKMHFRGFYTIADKLLRLARGEE